LGQVISAESINNEENNTNGNKDKLLVLWYQLMYERIATNKSEVNEIKDDLSDVCSYLKEHDPPQVGKAVPFISLVSAYHFVILLYLIIENYCPYFFDLVSCWKPAPPGTLALQACPKYIYGDAS